MKTLLRTEKKGPLKRKDRSGALRTVVAKRRRGIMSKTNRNKHWNADALQQGRSTPAKKLSARNSPEGLSWAGEKKGEGLLGG